MNRKKIFNTLGMMLQIEAFLLIPSILCAAIYGEECLIWLLLTAVITFVIGSALKFVTRKSSDIIYAREGFITVALTWVCLSAFGALPFTLSGEIPSYIDAFFETVSGFTTTGASILNNVEAMSHGLLFWRSFTHWVGGMGILVFMMAIVPAGNDRSIHIMRAEMPGPVVGKLVPRARDTAKILYIIYVGMTFLQVILMLFGGMSLFDSLVHAFGTAGTGGFGIRADSIGSYSPYLQWVITVFMFLFGVNFNLYYLLFARKFRDAAQSGEFNYYLVIVLVSTGIIALNIRSMFSTFGETLRASAFQVSSIITTTGFSTVNFDTWPQLSKSILLILMMIGACAGSTGGGLKVSRAVILVKMIGRELKHMLHPRSINSVKFEGRQVDGATIKSVSSYFALYIICIIFVFLVLSIEPAVDMETNASAAISCFNNIGPAFRMAGPAASYSFYSPLSKIVLSFAMLFGRLEIIPMLLSIIPNTWIRR